MAVIKKFQNNFTAGVISPGARSRVDLAKYASGCESIVNGVVHAHGGISNRPGTECVDVILGDGILIPFAYSVDQTYVLCFFDNGAEFAAMRVYTQGAMVTKVEDEAVVPVEVTTPYRPADLKELKFVQSADVMFFAHPLYRPYRFTRSVAADGVTPEWNFEQMTFAPQISAPGNLSASTAGFSDSSGTYYNIDITYKVSAVSDREEESVPSSAASATILSTWPSGARVTLTWDAVNGAVRYEVYKNAKGYYEWIGSAVQEEGVTRVSFLDNNIEGDANTGPKENRDPFVGAGNYPGVVSLYQQRLIYGRTNLEPQTVWCSEVGALDSMAVAQPLRDDSAITATADSRQMNEIRHFVPMKGGVLMLTSGTEFRMYAGRNNDMLSPKTIQFEPQSYWGTSDVPPVVSGNSVVIVTNDGRHVRDLYYQVTEEGYTGNEVSILAEHLFDSEVRDWAYQQSPFSTIWVVLESGKLLTFTYMREQEVWAWSEHQSEDCEFRSVSVVREGAEDDAYFLVHRNGRYVVEYQVRRHYGDAVEDAFFVDSGLRYSGVPTATVSGLDHLAGMEVTALADGSVIKHITVSDEGVAVLPFSASKITCGLPYSMVIKTLNQEIKGENGTVLGEPVNVFRVVFQLRESRSIEVGPSEDELHITKLPVADTYGEPPPLYTGEISTVLPGRHRTTTSIVFRQADPLPATVLSVVTEISVR